MRAQFVFLILLSVTASAQNIRSAVSIYGVDTATCAVADPCRTFSAAIARTNTDGEVVALTSGGYGPFEVRRAMSIIAPPGIHASIAPTSQTAIYVESSGRVVLRGLRLLSLGSSFGLEVRAVDRLYLDQLEADGFVQGFRVYVPAGLLWMRDVSLRANQAEGMSLARSEGSSTVLVALDRIRAENNYNAGVMIFGGVRASIDRSTLSGNAQGLNVQPGSISASLNRSIVAQNDAGINNFQGVRVSHTVITGNGIGVLTHMGGTSIGYGNNVVAGNDTNGTLTQLGQE